ncbi:TPA: hypothetical protein DF272_00630 [Candidatus Falkowbacteria bacterium]|nr:hypothetical protein [Candidatus Falkowbacteria bacterium]
MNQFTISIIVFVVVAIALYIYNKKTRSWKKFLAAHHPQILYQETSVPTRMFVRAREARVKCDLYLTSNVMFFVVKDLIWWRVHLDQNYKAAFSNVFSGDYLLPKSSFTLITEDRPHLYAESKTPVKTYFKIYSANPDQLLDLIKKN